MGLLIVICACLFEKLITFFQFLNILQSIEGFRLRFDGYPATKIIRFQLLWYTEHHLEGKMYIQSTTR